MEAQHEEADVLHEQRDEPEEDARADGDQGVAPHGQHVLLYAYLLQTTWRIRFRTTTNMFNGSWGTLIHFKALI